MNTKAQSVVEGIIKDEQTNELLVGVSVKQGKKGTTTNAQGYFKMEIASSDSAIMEFSYIGYLSKQIKVPSVSQTINLSLSKDKSQLNELVITGNRNASTIKQQTVSVDVIKPYLIENKITANLENIMNQLPSVNIVDGQINIRSGSGWTYGAGSRVLVLVDDVPMITGDAGQVQWKFLPTENIGSIEVVKGASSVMFGSSALNGVINIRTANPTPRAKLIINSFTGVYSKPKRDSAQWWKQNQWYSGVNGFYSKRYNQLDVTAGFNALNDNGYRLGEFDKRIRLYTKTNYRFKSLNSLNAGLNATVMQQQSASFLLWESFAYGYTSLDSAETQTNAFIFSIDPHADWIKTSYKIRYRGRFYGVDNKIDESTNGVNQDNNSINAYNELVAHYFLKSVQNTIAFGVTHNHTISNSPLFGGNKITADNKAIFSQLDLNLRRLSLNAGLRYELFNTNNQKDAQLIGRFGLNYKFHRATYVRASFGQGYRYPTIAERYIETSVGLVNIFPNPNLKPEKGYSAEIGLKQGFSFGKFSGLLDVAAFYTEYRNMVEYNFGQWRNRSYPTPVPGFDLRNIGFTSFNIGRASIAGIDVSSNIIYKTKKIELLILGGYTYTIPKMLTPQDIFAYDSSQQKRAYTYNFTSTDTSNNTLKYRYTHLAKIDVQVTIKNKIMFGTSLRYNSYMQNIDLVFVSPPVSLATPGVDRGIALNQRGDFIVDTRLGYTLQQLTISVSITNLFNKEIMTRPADLRPTRLAIIQLSYKL